MIVMKFGGTSVGSPERIRGVGRLVASTPGPCCVVTSAMAGVTDTLLAAGARAAAGDGRGASADVASLRARHREVAGDDAGLCDVIDGLCDDLAELLHGVSLLREQTPRSRALLASFGERLAAPLVAAAVAEAGREARAVDARTVVVTDDTWEEGRVDLEATRARASTTLRPWIEAGDVPVVTGFVAADPEGITTVLGRGGSDYTASILGAALDADEVWIWTDVPGILTADPRLVRDARGLSAVSYREAAEMSYFGAKVVHPKTMVPVQRRGIPLRVKSTFEPDHPGTVVSEATEDVPQGVKTVTAVRDLSLLTVEGRGLAGLPGVARRIFACTEATGANVVMISQASSEQTVSLVVRSAEAASLSAALDAQFALERAAGLVDPVRRRDGVAVVSVIGAGMAGRAGTSARLFGALGGTGVNVLAIAQGASELSISVAIDHEDAARAVRSVHTAFGLTRGVDLLLLGSGRVAQALLPMIDAARDRMAAERGVDLRLLGVASSSRVVLDPHGLPPGEALGRLAGGAARPSDEALLSAADAARSRDLVLVDLTAAPLASLHAAALGRGFHVVTANKVPLAGPLDTYRGLVRAVRETGARYGYETTFGAGLPVLHTLKELLHTGDTVEEVTGCFSGTLGFLCTRLQDGAPLAEAVQEAVDAGYTEPDPREDLSGRDVARKALIIARAMGLALEPEDVSRSPVVDGLERGLAEAVAAEGPGLEARIREAAARGGVLRYVARITPDEVAVGLAEVPADSPIGSLRGPDNILVFRSRRYRDYPLVVRGPGAGAEVTAAGVLGDLLRTASGGA